ncbi:MAG: hypothetical protein K6G16_01335 [Lachnospiraceae bacterium]|nr:hypothetical protein [Lachnospiraceae bacterium]
MQDETKKNWKSLLFPLVWEALFVASYLVVALRDDKRHFSLTLYFMFFFYLGLLVYYRRDFSLKEFFLNFTKWKEFILPVMFTAAGAALARAVFSCVGTKLFPDSLNIVLPLAYSSNVFETILFALTVMLLKPVASELFFRKGWIDFSGRGIFLFTVVTGFLLEAVTRSITPLGILETVLLAVPFVIAYCVTKNVYVSLFVHLIFGIVVNMPDVIYDFMRLALA